MFVLAKLVVAAGLASAQALQVHQHGLEPPVQGLHEVHGAPRDVLIVFVGLLPRGLDWTWNLMQKNFVKPNEAEGYRFKIVLHTDTSRFCSEKESIFINCSDAKEEHNWGKSLREGLGQVFSPYPMTLMDVEDPCIDVRGVSPTGKSFNPFNNRTILAECGTSHFTSRADGALAALDGQSLAAVLVVRTDRYIETVLKQPVLLSEACTRHPGVGIFRGTEYGDWDWAWLLCDGSKVDLFRRALLASGLPCDESCNREHAPAMPPAFERIASGPPKNGWSRSLHKVSCRSVLCRTVSILQGQLDFATMDDYALAAPC